MFFKRAFFLPPGRIKREAVTVGTSFKRSNCGNGDIDAVCLLLHGWAGASSLDGNTCRFHECCRPPQCLQLTVELLQGDDLWSCSPSLATLQC